MNADQARADFSAAFQREAIVVARAPGRVNLIGEHTDYNDGFVLPIAIRECTWVAVAPRSDNIACVRSTAFDGQAIWNMGAWSRASQSAWTAYVAGVVAQLQRRQARLAGFDMLVASDVPLGGGLSSSAALEVGVLLALAYLAGEPVMALDVVDLCRQAEHEFAGVSCGLMDPTAVLLGKEGQALRLDCRSRGIEYVSAQLDGCAWLVIDSGVRHALAQSEYGRRQEECRAAVAYFSHVKRGVRALRDVNSETVRAHIQQMDPTAAARALHVTTENERVLAAVAALKAGAAAEFGRLLRQSHRSLRDQYQVTCAELDQLFEGICALPGVYGARMTGGGFGGCLVALVRESAIDGVGTWLARDYNSSGVTRAELKRVEAGPGAQVIAV